MKHMMSGMNELLGAWSCVVASFALLIYSVRVSLEGAPGGVWLTLASLALFIAGVLKMGKKARR